MVTIPSQGDSTSGGSKLATLLQRTTSFDMVSRIRSVSILLCATHKSLVNQSLAFICNRTSYPVNNSNRCYDVEFTH